MVSIFISKTHLAEIREYLIEQSFFPNTEKQTFKKFTIYCVIKLVWMNFKDWINKKYVKNI